MKKILVPTDFSPGAWRAALYAADLALAANASLILFHAYELNSIVSAPSIIYMMNEVTRGKEFEHLRIWSDRLREAAGNDLRVFYYCTHGRAAEEIPEAVLQNDPDLVVLGLRGAGRISHKLFGSVTTALMRHLSRPVLAVPDHATFHTPRKIVFATDYESMSRPQDLALLSELVQLFGARLALLHIKEPEPVGITADQSAEAERIVSPAARSPHQSGPRLSGNNKYR